MQPVTEIYEKLDASSSEFGRIREIFYRGYSGSQRGFRDAGRQT
jgi:hypothetical protein